MYIYNRLWSIRNGIYILENIIATYLDTKLDYEFWSKFRWFFFFNICWLKELKSFVTSKSHSQVTLHNTPKDDRPMGVFYFCPQSFGVGFVRMISWSFLGFRVPFLIKLKRINSMDFITTFWLFLSISLVECPRTYKSADIVQYSMCLNW